MHDRLHSTQTYWIRYVAEGPENCVLMSLSGVSDRIHLRTPGTIHSVNHCHINFSLQHFILPLLTSQIFNLNGSNAVSQLTMRKEVQSQPQFQFSLFVSPISPYPSYNSCYSPNRKCCLLTKKVISWVSDYKLEYLLQEALVMNTIIYTICVLAWFARTQILAPNTASKLGMLLPDKWLVDLKFLGPKSFICHCSTST